MLIHHPKPYLSYSQFSLFKDNPKEYYKRYVDNIRFSNKWTEFGKWVHSELEKPKSDDNVIELIRPNIKVGKNEVEVKAKLDDIPLLGYVDIMNNREKYIVDIKTSGKEWTQKKADEEEQLTFYSILIREAYGWIPQELIIHWIETKGDPLYLTGNNKEIITTREQWQLDMLEEEIKEVWEEIGIYCGKRYNF